MTDYIGCVRMMVTRLALLLAMLLMPLGMAPLAAGPTPGAAQHEAMGHCPDNGSSDTAGGGIVECTMACAGALPAAGHGAHDPLPMPRERTRRLASHQLDGLHPETATPPPKSS